MKDIFLRVECFFHLQEITSVGFVFVKRTGLRRDMTRQNTLSLRKQPLRPRSSLAKSYNISKEHLQIETKFLRLFSQALVLRRTMAWTPWMLFGTPRSFEKPWRMMRSLETNGGISTLQLDFIDNSLIQGVEDWFETQKLHSDVIFGVTFGPVFFLLCRQCQGLQLLDLDTTEVCSGYWKPPSFLIALSTVPLASLARMEDLELFFSAEKMTGLQWRNNFEQTTRDGI